MEGADGTSINTNPLIYTCEVGMRREDGIKGKGGNQKGGEKKRNIENISIIKVVTQLKNNI